MTAWEDTRMFDVPTVAAGDPPAGTVELDPADEARAAVSFAGGDGAGLLRADAVRLPLADESVDLVVTSPPYFALRSYQDGDGHYDGQIGSEATPQAFLEALWAVTAECARVLKPSGSMFVNLGDKYAGSGGHNNASDRYNQNSGGVPAKSLMLLPERYRIGCVDRLGLIARAVIIWDKPNGLPEPVQDRVRRSHEDWVHLTKQPRYYAAVDEIREAYSPEASARRAKYGQNPGRDGLAGLRATGAAQHGSNGVTAMGVGGGNENPLGKLPGSVWEVATEPLRVPEWVGVDHFAAFPTEWPRRLILGWSPSGVITGEACACPTPDAPTRPAVVLDPFGGTGTTAMVARSLGRFGVSVDLSADYLRLARWRMWSSGHGQKAVSRTWRDRQGSLFEEGAA